MYFVYLIQKIKTACIIIAKQYTLYMFFNSIELIIQMLSLAIKCIIFKKNLTIKQICIKALDVSDMR